MGGFIKSSDYLGIQDYDPSKAGYPVKQLEVTQLIQFYSTNFD